MKYPRIFNKSILSLNIDAGDVKTFEWKISWNEAYSKTIENIKRPSTQNCFTFTINKAIFFTIFYNITIRYFYVKAEK